MGRSRRGGSLLLAGMMGAGKSSAGRVLAARLGWEFVDTDALVAERAGLSIAELFQRAGEAHFRRLEREVISELPGRRAVVALGGGAVVPAENRAILARKGTLVWLDARPETLARRIGSDEARPLLAGADAATRLERLRALREERSGAYAEAAVRVETDARDVDEVCDAVLEALGWGCAA